MRASRLCFRVRLSSREPFILYNRSMAFSTLDEHIEVTPGVTGGKARIAGRRITVENVVVWHERMGKSADEIATEHDLALADVYAALTYYFDHRDEIDESIREGDSFAEALRRGTSSKLREKLAARELRG